MKHLLLAFVAMLFFVGCSSHEGSPITGGTTTTSGIKTCIKSGVAGTAVPAGTIAKRLSDGATAKLDANGCYELPATGIAAGFAARSTAAADSVQLYNDSALFAITIPFTSAGDTISVVPTIVTLQNAPNAEVDSVLLIVYDKAHALSRYVKLRQADYGDSSSWSRTLWSEDAGAAVKVHFQISGTRTFASSVYTVNPGSVVIRNWTQVKAGAVPFIPHTYTDTMMIDSNWVSMNLVYKIDTIVDTSVKTVKINQSSIYGIQSMTVDGVAATTINVESVVNASKTFYITLTDSVGYTTSDSVKVVRYSGQLHSRLMCLAAKAPMLDYINENNPSVDGLYVCVN